MAWFNILTQDPMMPLFSARFSRSSRRTLRFFSLESLEGRRLLSGTDTLRIVTYNIESDLYSQGIVAPPEPAFATVLEGIGAESYDGISRPIDILALQETSGNELTAAPIVAALNTYYGAGTYAYSSFQPSTTGETDGNGPNALIYNTTTVTLVSSVGVGSPSDSGYPRQPVRYEFQPVGGSAADDFYVYDSHYKSGDERIDDNGERRLAEAQAILADAATLPANSHILYVGDYNSFYSDDPGYATITAPGPNQGYDPIDQPVFLNGPLQTLTETDTGLEERLDFELPTANVLDDPTGGLYLIPGSYHVFGNDGSVRNVSESTTALSGLPNRTAVLQDLVASSDHLPVVADYTDTVTAPVGPAVSSLAVSPTSVAAGANVELAANVVEYGPGSIASVDFYRESNGIDGLQMGSDAFIGAGTENGSTWTLTTSTSGLGGGVYTYYAVATDNSNAVSSPVSTTLTVSGPNTPSIASFTASPSTVVAGANVTLEAVNVTQSGGAITNVQFYSETNGTPGLQIGSDLTLGNGTESGSNWVFVVSTLGLPTGTQDYYAIATSNTGASSTTALVAVTITDPQPPTIGSFTVSPTSVTAGATVTLTANNVVGNGGSIAYVNFYLEDNGVPGLQESDSFVGAGTENGTNWSTLISTAGLAAGTYTFYAVATDSNDLSNNPLSVTLTVTPPSLPFVDLEILASASPTGPFVSSLSVTPAETVYFEVVGQLAPVGTTNGTHTITSLTSVDGINSLSFDLLDSDVSTLPISFISSILATQSTTPAAAASWSAGISAGTGAPQSVDGGTDNELTNVRPSHAPGVFTAGSAADVIELGSFTVASSAAQGGTSQITGSFGGVTSGFQINNGSQKLFLSNDTENSPNPLMSISPVSLTVATLPAWLSPGSAATWNASTKTLTVTGAATIIADPGSDSPNIVASGSEAVLTIQPATVGFVNLGGITLSGGASIIVPSVGAGRTHTNHNVIVLDSNGTTVPTFSIGDSSKLDLADNDLIIQNGGSELSTIQAAATLGQNLAAGNTWTGNGLTSSAAAAGDANAGFEEFVLAVALNGNLPSGSYSSWQAGSATLALGTNDVIVKYTFNGDFDLDGMVDDSDAGIISAYYGTLSGVDFTDGDTDGNGTVDDNDIGFFDAVFSEGTGGSNGNQL
jgi:endonuclease/exonuclease/phosphatase family metal-dependent hydrolase